MTCQRCRERLSDLLEGGLDPVEENEVQAHLAECDDCALSLEQIRGVVEAVRSLPEVEPPEDLRERLRVIPEDVEAETAPIWRRTRHLFVGVAAAAALVLVTWMGLSYHQRSSDVEMAPRQVATERMQIEAEDLTEPDAEIAEAPAETDEVMADEDAIQPPDPAVDETTEALESVVASRPDPEIRRQERPRRAPAPGESRDTQLIAEEAEVAELPEAPPSREAQRITEPASPQESTAARPSDTLCEQSIAEISESEQDDGEAVRGTLPMPRAAYLDEPGIVSTTAGDGTPFMVAVRPPTERMTGAVVPATIIIETEEDVARAKISATGSEGLELIGLADDDAVFDGPLMAGQETVLSVRMMARNAGEQTVCLRVRSTDPIVDTRLDVSMGDFTEPIPPAERKVQFDFVGKTLRDAVAEIVRESGLKVTVAEDVREATVTVRMEEEIPALAALRMIAEAADCQVIEADDAFIVQEAREEQ